MSKKKTTDLETQTAPTKAEKGKKSSAKVVAETPAKAAPELAAKDAAPKKKAVKAAKTEKAVKDKVAAPSAKKSTKKAASTELSSSEAKTPRTKAEEKAANPGSVDGVQAVPSPAITQEEIAKLAYFYAEARGFQGGSPEEDWFRAEQELRRLRGL